MQKKLREKIFEFFAWYDEFQNKPPIKTVEIYSGDFQCTNSCKIDLINTKLNLIGLIYTVKDVRQMIEEESKKFGIALELTANLEN